jgi:cyanophycin synthetase
MKLDLEDLEEKPTNTIQGFSERIETLMPSLFSHRCSEDHEGGFFERVKEGTWMGHVIEHVALELQWLAGMDCGFGRTRETSQKGVYNVIFSYEIPEAGYYAAQAAVRIAESLITGEEYDLETDIKKLKRIKETKGLGPTTESIIKEARRRNIPYKRLDNDSLIMLGYGINQKKVKASITENTSQFGVEISDDKEETKRVLAKAYIPVPEGEVIYTEQDLEDAIENLKFPLVIKPVDSNHGKGITTNVQNAEQALQAFNIAKNYSDGIIIERFIEGDDYRFLVINYKLVAAAKRTPASIMGDGFSTIAQLVEQTNADPMRGEGHDKVLTTIKIDEVTLAILAKKELTPDSVLPIGEILFLKDTANLSTGGTSKDVTDKVHPQNAFMAERIARLLNLDICGIDVMAKDISKPLPEQNGAVLEVNAAPGFRMHLSPSKGLPRNVAEPVVDMLFPPGKPVRIPIVAVTGTNGKTTTTRLTAHIAKTAGHVVGYTTTDGIYIQGHVLRYGDCTGETSAETILTDPTVDFAVLECARGGILRAGLGFDHCDISIITNVSEDHLGLHGINTIEEMAQVKSVVAKSTFSHGYSILNADDDLVYKMAEELNCNIALFSMSATNERIKSHCAKGGLAAVIEKGYLTICKGEWKIRICKIADVPLAFGGRAHSMIKNILPAVMAAIIQDFKIEDIRKALQSFIPSPELTPGRMNIFNFKNFDVMIDYAHNAAGFIELKKFLDYTNASPKIGIISAVGDRRNEDIVNVGVMSGQIFDQIIIRHDEDLRGKTKEEITELLMAGIRQSDSDMPVMIISNEKDALTYAMETAEKGAFICTFTESVRDIIEFVSKAHALEESDTPTTQNRKVKAI